MEEDEVCYNSAVTSEPKDSNSNPSNSEDKETDIILDEPSKSHALEIELSSLSESAVVEKIVIGMTPDKDHARVSSGDDEFISILDSESNSDSNLNEIELEQQLEQASNPQEEVINLNYRLDSPIPKPDISLEDSNSNYSPPMASSSSSSNDALYPIATPPLARSSRNTYVDSTDLSRGQLVWAKVSGFRFWPGLLVDVSSATNLPSKLRTPYREGWLLVHFFGTYDYAWVPPKSCILGLSEAKRYENEGTTPAGFSVVPQVLESGSDTDSIISVGSSEDKPKTGKRKYSSKDIAVVSIKKMKLSDYQMSSSSQGSTSTEINKLKMERKKRCELVMKRLGLAPPDKYLGRKLPEKINTEIDYEQ
ncbi:Oxidoreductase GLYR1 [Oopsacas minuta]|uniref:Oxidoreductase GLYR1 n=1 Tax=Oopsacas minuta TaxID=111878 RepID=A0AAV7KL40_9METZ|nr:Oxidoreductase GLYR1 [Oopsacas minuta]